MGSVYQALGVFTGSAGPAITKVVNALYALSGGTNPMAKG